jgi:hypothetical protein
MSLLRSKGILSALSLAVVSLVGRAGEATQGNWTITQNTTLTEDHYGSITIAADNTILDCANHNIIFSAAVPTSYNCTNVSPMTCGISVKVRYNAQVRNCHIQGGFGAGVKLKSTTWALVQDSTATGAHIGFMVEQGDHVRLNTLQASGNSGSGFYLVQAQLYVMADALTAFSNGGDGFSASYCESINLIGGSFSSNGGSGAWFSNGAGNVIDANQFLYNGAHGLDFSNTRSSLIENNFGQGNNSGCDAIQSGSTYNTWQGNTFYNWCGTVPASH